MSGQVLERRPAGGPGPLATARHDGLTARLRALAGELGVTVLVPRQGLCVAPFGEQFKPDLVLAGLSAYPDGLAVVARWQEGSGSADRKVLYDLACIRRSAAPTYLVLDGAGWRPGVWDYLAGEVAGPFLGALDHARFARLLAGLRGR